MPKVIFSAFQPKTQMWVGFAGAASFLVSAMMSLLQTPITVGDVISVLNFLLGAAFLSYVGYSGYRRQHGAAVENPVNMDPRSRQKIDLVMIALANVTMAAVIIWRSRTGDIDSTVAWISAGISFIVGNAAIIFGIRVRQRSAIPLRLTVFTVVCAILSATVTALAVRSTSQGNDVTRLAFSSTPLANIQPEQKRLVVELIRKRNANSRAYERIAANMKPLRPPLYSVESLANENAIRETVARLKQSTDADFAYYAKQQQVTKDFREKMMRVDPTSNYLKDLNVWTSQDVLQTTFKLEQELLSSTLALYDYAARHAKGLTVDGKLKFPTEKSRLEFIKLQTASTVLFKTFQETTLKNQADYKRARAARLI